MTHRRLLFRLNGKRSQRKVENFRGDPVFFLGMRENLQERRRNSATARRIYAMTTAEVPSLMPYAVQEGYKDAVLPEVTVAKA
jgi:hypothetical protein